MARYPQIVSSWSYMAEQQTIVANLLNRPAEHPGAFMSLLAPQELAYIAETSVNNDDFLAKVELQELGDMLSRFAQEYAPLDQDRIEFSRYDFENAINLEMFQPRVDANLLFVTQANFGQPQAQVNMTFSARSAEEMLDKLGVAGCSSLELQRHDTGLWSLKADGQLFVIEDLAHKVEKDLNQMCGFEQQSLAYLIGVEIKDLAERLVIWFKEVGHAPY